MIAKTIWVFVAIMSFLLPICSVAQENIVRAFIAIAPPRSLHPNDGADGIILDHLNQIYDTLFWIDYDGKLQPSLATKWTRVDPFIIDVDLRQGVKFQNGEVFDSRSAKLTFDLFLSTSHPAQNRFYGETIKEVKILDAFRVRIITTVPDNLLPFRLATVGLMVPPDYYQKVGAEVFSKNPIGTGPFKYNAGRSNDKEMVLEANKNYWGGPPKIDELHFVYFASVDNAVKALLRGELDFVAHVPGKYTTEISKNPLLKINKKLTLQQIVLLLNTKKKNSPLKDLAFRKALRQGIDFSHVIKYGYNGNGIHVESLTLPGEPFHVNIPSTELDVAYAKAGISKKAKNFKFVFLATKPFDLAGGIVAEQIKRLGMDLDVRYGSDEDEMHAVLEKNQTNIVPEIDFLFSYCSDQYATGSFLLLTLLHSKANWSMTDDPQLDVLLDAAKTEFDAEKQKKYFQKAVRYAYDNALIMPAFQLEDVFGLRKGLNYKPHITGYLYFKDMAVNEK